MVVHVHEVPAGEDNSHHDTFVGKKHSKNLDNEFKSWLETSLTNIHASEYCCLETWIK